MPSGELQIAATRRTPRRDLIRFWSSFPPASRHAPPASPGGFSGAFRSAPAFAAGNAEAAAKGAGEHPAVATGISAAGT
jgi:hypothetical protein